ncbi:MAG: exo-alpha-sialidase [Bacteroidaceae bacterium]|nr:exo-alpha-sialidase [Bacteroidaceae bacterium]
MKRNLLFQFLMIFACVASWAAVPFKTTTVVDGTFAEDTPWYTMRIDNGGKIISDNDAASYITLGRTTTQYEDCDLWCFTGSESEGFRLYNKQAGATKVLAASSQMGTDGGSNYPVLRDASSLAGYTDLWDFSSSTSIADTEGWYMKLHGTNSAVNNYGGSGKLAFWTDGQDAGSTIVFNEFEIRTEVLLSTGSFTSSNASGTFHSKWSSSEVDGLTFGTSVNNMQSSGDNLVCYTGSGCTYTITAPVGYVVYAYSFDFVNNNEDASYSLTLAVNGTTYNSSATMQSVSVTGLEERTASFTQSGANKGVVVSNFKVILRSSIEVPEPSFDVFPTLTTAAIPYRIPAIATANNGDIIAVADYRHSRADIGMANYGRIDLHARISRDNGKTWGEIFPIVEGMGSASPDFMNVGFGDPCIVADRDSSHVLVLSCAGNVSYPSGQRNNHQNIARFYSKDNGQTWSEPVDIAESIYSQFDSSTVGAAKAMFIGSGKISQSKTIKVNNYYRLYCAVLLKNEHNTETNYVLYSDDFGETWKVLGGVNVAPIPSGANEPKADELPDGSVLVSSRCNGGRYYNIYSYTDSEKAEGSWGSMQFSGASNNGTTAVSNSTNGEIMIVPVTRKSDEKDMYLLLQSLPFGSGRANVGIYYKELESLRDFLSPEAVARDWDGRHQSTSLSSAYSTMCWQADSTIAFLYEEDTYGTSGGGYTIVYKNYSIEYITDSAYTYNPNVDSEVIVSDGIEAKVEALGTGSGNYVGCLIADGKEQLDAAVDAYKEAPSKTAYEALNAAIASAPRIEVVPNAWYRLRNTTRSNATLYLKPNATAINTATSNLANPDQMFSFVPATDEDTYYLYNGNYSYYLGPLGANETQPAVVTDAGQAGIWRVESSSEGKSSLICTNKTGGNNGLHLAGDNSRLVPWTSSADASLWYIEPVETYTISITAVGYKAAMYPFAFSVPEGMKAYTAGTILTVDSVDCLAINEIVDGFVPAGTPVLLEAAQGSYDLLVEASAALYEGTNTFNGVLKSSLVSGGNIYTLTSEGVFKNRNVSSLTIMANTAYFQSETAVEKLALVKNVETGIEDIIDNGSKDVKLYDLNGRLVKNPSKGIYITSDGIKVLVE